MRTRNCRWCGWCIRGWKHLKAHVRSCHPVEWRAGRAQLLNCDTKLEQLEGVANTLSHGWNAFEPIERGGHREVFEL